MGVVSLQLVINALGAVLMQWCVKYKSFGQWLLCTNLYRYRCPTDEELRAAEGKSSRPHRKGRGDNNHVSDTISKSTVVPLDRVPMTPVDCLTLKFSPDLQSLLDISLCALFIFVLTEVYFGVYVGRDALFNLSIIWCLFVIGSCVKLFVSLTAQYFGSGNFSEGALCCTSGFVFFVLSSAIMMAREGIFDIDMEGAYHDFVANATAFLKNHGLEPQVEPISCTTFKIFLCVLSSLMGLILTFPGLRYAKLHLGVLKTSTSAQKVVLYVNFLFPMLVCLLWLASVRDEVLHKGILDMDTFRAVRLWSVIIFCILRLLVTKLHLQFHLDTVNERIQRLNTEPGRISTLDFRRLIVHINCYLGVVASQYVLPIVLVLFMNFCLKTLGGLTWAGVYSHSFVNVVSNSTTNDLNPTKMTLRSVFTEKWCYGIFSYFTAWNLFCMSLTSLFGVVYHSNFETSL